MVIDKLENLEKYVSLNPLFVQNRKIAISQVTSVSEDELSGIRDKMLEYMESCLKTSGLSMQFAMLTNIIEEKTELLYVGKGAAALVRAAFKKKCGEHSVELPGSCSTNFSNIFLC